MQERVYEEVETLWPYGGFAVRAFERKLGEGKLTLTEQSLLFEAKNGEAIGFDLNAIRLIRLKDVNTIETAYSIQGELRNTSLRIICTFTDGTEREELPSENDPFRTSLFRVITGGVLARFLADHANARLEGLIRMTNEEFEARIKDLESNISLFPSKKEYEDDVWADNDLQIRSLEAAESEPQIWNDPHRDKLFYTGTNPTMTIDNAFEKIDLLQEDWVKGRLDSSQRARSVAMDYKIDLRQNELGYLGARGGPSEVWKDRAARVKEFEKRIGVDILQFV